LAHEAALKSDGFVFCSSITQEDHYRIFPQSSRTGLVVNFGHDHQINWNKSTPSTEFLGSKNQQLLDKDFRLLMLGDLDFRKNIEVVVQALEILRADNPDFGFRLDHLGNTANLGITKNVLLETSVGSNIHFHGWVSDQIRTEYILAADLLLFPSIVEGYGFPVLEALSHGTPVLSSERVPAALLLQSIVRLLSPYDPQAWASAILESNLAKIRGGQKNKEVLVSAVATFTWESCTKEIVSWLSKTNSKP